MFAGKCVPFFKLWFSNGNTDVKPAGDTSSLHFIIQVLIWSNKCKRAPYRTYKVLQCHNSLLWLIVSTFYPSVYPVEIRGTEELKCFEILSHYTHIFFFVLLQTSLFSLTVHFCLAPCNNWFSLNQKFCFLWVFTGWKGHCASVSILLCSLSILEAFIIKDGWV